MPMTQAGQDDRQPDRGLATGPPAEERVGEQQHADAGVQPHRLVGPQELRDRGGADGAERDGDREERARPPPQQRRDRHQSDHDRDRRPGQILAEQAFEQRGRHQHRDEHPVPPHPGGRRRGSRLCPQRPGGGPHRASVRNPGARRYRPQVRVADRPIGRGKSSLLPDGARRPVPSRSTGAGPRSASTELRRRHTRCRTSCIEWAASAPAGHGP